MRVGEVSLKELNRNYGGQLRKRAALIPQQHDPVAKVASCICGWMNNSAISTIHVWMTLFVFRYDDDTVM